MNKDIYTTIFFNVFHDDMQNGDHTSERIVLKLEQYCIKPTWYSLTKVALYREQLHSKPDKYKLKLTEGLALHSFQYIFNID